MPLANMMDVFFIETINSEFDICKSQHLQATRDKKSANNCHPRLMTSIILLSFELYVSLGRIYQLITINQQAMLLEYMYTFISLLVLPETTITCMHFGQCHLTSTGILSPSYFMQKCGALIDSVQSLMPILSINCVCGLGTLQKECWWCINYDETDRCNSTAQMFWTSYVRCV